MTNDELMQLFYRHRRTHRKSDYITLPFEEFATIDKTGREYEWYAARYAFILHTKNVFPCYADKRICIKKGDNTVKAKWTVEIPYGHRSKYIDFIVEVNKAISREGMVAMFVCNIPYALKAYLTFEDEVTNTADVNHIIEKHGITRVYTKGINELLTDAMLSRQYNSASFPLLADREHIKNTLSMLFYFQEIDDFSKNGFDITADTIRKKVFISYSHANKETVHSITNTLEDAGINLWIDKRCIDYGENIIRAISTGIAESDLAILFLSRDIITSNFSQYELENILNLFVSKAMGLFIVKLDDVNVNDIFPTLSSYLYYDFYENNDIHALIRALQNKLSKL